MLLKYTERGLIVLQLTERVFIDDGRVICVLEDTRCDPGLWMTKEGPTDIMHMMIYI